MSTELLSLAVSVLEEIVEEVVFVGGASLPLWITDPGAPPPRPTKDVDVIVEISTRTDYYAFETRLRDKGLQDDQDVICRWHHYEAGLILDAMPTDAEILGFENLWQRRAFPHAKSVTLSSGETIQAVSPEYLLATKLEAFAARGKDDPLGSRDYADIVALVDGREGLLEEINASPPELRRYLAEAVEALGSGAELLGQVQMQLLPDEASQARAASVVIPRLSEIAGRPH